MAKLNINQASKKAKISRQTLYRHMGKGLLSFELDSDGKKVIDESELERYIENRKGAVTPVTKGVTKPVTPVTTLLQDHVTENEALRRENEQLKERLKRAEKSEDWFKTQLEEQLKARTLPAPKRSLLDKLLGR